MKRLTLLGTTILLCSCGAGIRPIQNARPQVTTPLPEQLWICNDSGTLCQSGTINDIPPGYDCFVQQDRQVACWPVDTPSSVTSKGLPAHSQPPQQPQAKAKPLTTLIEHLALGAGSYLGMAALAGPDHRLQVGLPAVALMSAFKEGTDAHDGTDTRGQAIRHIIMILAGAGVGAAVYH